MSNLNIIPKSSPVYSTFKSFAVPMFIFFMLLDINIRGSIKVAWRSIGVLVIGCIGVVFGAVIAFFAFKSKLPPDAWSGFGALAGSWIGGTGNLAAVAEGLNTPPDFVGIVVLADNFVLLPVIPLLLMCKRWAPKIDRFTKVKASYLAEFRVEAAKIEEKTHEIHYRDVLTLFGFGFIAILISNWLGTKLPEISPVLTSKTWSILLITTLGILGSTTPLKKVPGTKPISMGLVFTYLCMMGAMADLNNIGNAHYFIIAAFICVIVHLIFVLLAARIFRVDTSMAAVSSIAALGGAASGPVVAGYHREELVPISIILALIGYGLGNYLGVATAYLCHALL